MIVRAGGSDRLALWGWVGGGGGAGFLSVRGRGGDSRNVRSGRPGGAWGELRNFGPAGSRRWPRGELGARPDPELAVNPAKMSFDGPDTGERSRGDLSVGLAGCHQVGDPLFD